MSYLHVPRLVFSGDFQADVSTVNNDVRHYDNATFEPRFQQLQEGPILNGWWNPTGSGAFRLVGCRVQKTTYADGSEADTPAADPVIGLFVGASDHQVSGKLVDLDPQWQMSSQIWGLSVRLTDGTTSAFMAGQFEPTAFRDIYFGRQPRGSVNGQTASAVFQSVLTNVVWPAALPGSRFLNELRAAATQRLLSITLTTFGYFTVASEPRFTLGKVIGAIAPAHANEPHSFVLGRRTAPANGQVTQEGISFFNCIVDAEQQRVSADLGNALPLTDPYGTLRDLGRLSLVVLHQADDAGESHAVQEGDGIGQDSYTLIGDIQYTDNDWLLKTAGIVDFVASPATLALARDHPLALVALSNTAARVVIRETVNGLFVRADRFVHTMDPEVGQAAVARTTFYAAQYGQPRPEANIAITLLPPQDGLGGGSPGDPDPPGAPIPQIGTPPQVLSIPAVVTTGPDGQGELVVQAQSPNNPRGYLDGQIYNIAYGLPEQAPNQLHFLDLVILHVRDAFKIPDQPTWLDDIQAIFVQYGNLYPIMSKWLIDLGDYDAVKQNRAILDLAFSRDISDPNHMPVTRDLSANKQAMILRWLRHKNRRGEYTLDYGPRPAQPPVPLAARVATEVTPAAAEEDDLLPGEVGGKAPFMRDLMRSLAPPTSE